ncbi:diguanylate cyclase [Pseudomonas putida]|uniref:diguanylate cyclase n=1 Tax=Pseudomonas putida TaxID=303 RepID=UPI0013A6C4FF|nr:diguanylate cyclase [Pseudomonas putida]
MTPSDAPVRAIGDEQLAAIPGLFRDSRTLRQDLILSRTLSQMFPAQYQAKRYIEHVLYVSTTGVVVAYPRIPDEKLPAVLKAFAASRLIRPRAQSTSGADVAFMIIQARQVFLGARLLLTTSLISNGVPRGAILFEVLQQRLQDYLYAGTPPDELHVLLDQRGSLIATNQETFNDQEGNWLNTLPETVSGLSMPAMFQSGKGVLRGGDDLYFYRVLHDSELLLLNKVSINELRWSVIEQFSSIFIFVWLSLAALLVVTLFVVDHLLLNQMRLNARLTELGLVDALTQLANRRRLQADFKGLVRRLQGKQPIALLMIDIDRFKFINDNWGHTTGDEVLKHLATLCRALVRPHDLVARYGGEEFCVMLPATTLDDASRIAEKLRIGIEQSVCLPDPVMMLASAPSREVHLTVSIGVAELGADQVTGLEALVAKADRRLYAAKENGRNQVVSDDHLVSD